MLDELDFDSEGPVPTDPDDPNNLSHIFFMTQEIITAKPRLLAVANSIIASKLDEEVPSFPGPGDTRPDTSADASVALTEELYEGLWAG
jgi:hypothetical protein